MNRVEEELRLKLQLRLDEENKSSIEKAQKENTVRIGNFILGVAIWFISFSILSYLQEGFHFFILGIILAIDIAISAFGKAHDIGLGQLLKIRLSIIYITVIILSMIIEISNQ